MSQLTQVSTASQCHDDRYAEIVSTAKIAIIDDEITNIEIVQTYLEEAGYHRFFRTTDSTEALDSIRNEQPDCVLLDLMMPEVSGLDILEAMRSDEQLRHIPVIVLTAATGAETKLEALNLGSSDFLAKPVDASELLLRLRNVLSSKVYQDHLADMVTVQKELLDRTFTGAVCMMSEIIESIESPAIDSSELRRIAQQLIADLGIESNWTVPLASRLLVVGLPLLTHGQRHILSTESVASASHREIVKQLFQMSSNLIRKIPRLDPVVELIDETLHVDGTMAVDAIESRTFATVLVTGFYVDLLSKTGASPNEIVTEMRNRFPAIDRTLMASTHELLGLSKKRQGTGKAGTSILYPEDLKAGMLVATRITDSDNRLLVAEGRALTEPMIMRLRQMAESEHIEVTVFETPAE